MIRRTSDFSLFSDEQLTKIAKVVEDKENKKLFDTFDDSEKARITAKELKVQGYLAEVYQAGEKWKVYIKSPETISLKEAESTGAFKKVAFGRYVFEKSSSLEMHEYSFNHGSIWRISTDEHGNQVLVKECDEENEEEVIRKTASLQKVAQNFSYVDANNFNNVFKVIFNITALNQVGTNFLNDLYNGSATNLQLYFIEKLNEDLDEYVNQVVSAKALQTNEVEEVKDIIRGNFDAGQFTTLQDIDATVEDYILEKNSGETTEEQI